MACSAILKLFKSKCSLCSINGINAKTNYPESIQHTNKLLKFRTLKLDHIIMNSSERTKKRVFRRLLVGDSGQGELQKELKTGDFVLKLKVSKSMHHAGEASLQEDPSKQKSIPGHVVDHMTFISGKLYSTMKNIEEYIEGINQPSLKFYDGNTLKTQKGIHQTLDGENNFHDGRNYLKKPGSGWDNIEKRMPYFPERDNYLRRKKVREQRPMTGGKLVGTKVLDLRTHTAERKTPKITELLFAEERKEHVKADLENLFSRKNSAPSVISTAAESLIPSAINTVRTSTGNGFVQINERKVSKTSTSFNFNKRKELIEELMSKRNIETMDSIYKRPELQDEVVITNGKMESVQKKRDLSSKKPGDGVYYQILAMNKTQRARVRQKLHSTLPTTIKYQHLFQD